MYKIKQIPTDFVVKEISNFKIEESGKYLILKLKKENYNTLDAIKIVARKLGVLPKDVGFAGSKDKKAITEQLISIQIGSKKQYLDKNWIKEKIAKLELRNISLEFLDYASLPITLGDLEGNNFEIVVRNLNGEDLSALPKEVPFYSGVLGAKITKLCGQTNHPFKIINYFGEQRFGGHNKEVGKAIIKKDFKQASELIDSLEVKEHLQKKKNDYVGAIRLISKRLLRLYVNAYQSYLWNETVKELIEKKIEIKKVPLIGFASDLDDLTGNKENNQKLKNIIENLLEKEKMELTDFIIKQIPNLSLEGSIRKVLVEVKELKILEKEKDELNKGKKKIKISFNLPKSSYATIVVNELFG